MVCDYAQDASNGKLNLFGVFEDFLPKSLPAALPTFYVYASIEVTKTDKPKAGTELRIEFRDPKGLVVGFAGGPLPADTAKTIKEGTLQLNVQIPQAVIAKEGLYEIVVLVGGTELHSLPVKVKVVK